MKKEGCDNRYAAGPVADPLPGGCPTFDLVKVGDDCVACYCNSVYRNPSVEWAWKNSDSQLGTGSNEA